MAYLGLMTQSQPGVIDGYMCFQLTAHPDLIWLGSGLFCEVQLLVSVQGHRQLPFLAFPNSQDPTHPECCVTTAGHKGSSPPREGQTLWGLEQVL